MPRPEQTERATPKRLEESRKKGQLARSTELAGAGIFLGAILALHFFAGSDFGGLGPGTMVALSHIASYDPLTIDSVCSGRGIARLLQSHSRRISSTTPLLLAETCGNGGPAR